LKSSKESSSRTQVNKLRDFLFVSYTTLVLVCVCVCVCECLKSNWHFNPEKERKKVSFFFLGPSSALLLSISSPHAAEDFPKKGRRRKSFVNCERKLFHSLASFCVEIFRKNLISGNFFPLASQPSRWTFFGNSVITARACRAWLHYIWVIL